jgi:type II secretory pathway component PulF
VKLEVEKGGTISLGLKNYPKTFPPIFSQMILIGEKSGSLEDSFLYLSSFYQEEVDSILKNLSVILEPVLLILVGIFVGFIALAIITPLYKFTGSIRFK